VKSLDLFFQMQGLGSYNKMWWCHYRGDNQSSDSDRSSTGCFPFDDTSRYKYRSVFVIYWMPRKRM